MHRHPMENVLRGPGDIRRSSQPMSNECRSNSSLIGKLTAHAKNWLPIIFSGNKLNFDAGSTCTVMCKCVMVNV